MQRTPLVSSSLNFQEILHHPEQALKADPLLLGKQEDRRGNTVLHALASSTLGLEVLKRAATVLLKAATKDNLEIRNKDGDTPIHVVLMHCIKKQTYFYLCPEFLKRAVELEFDFSLPGFRSYRALHLAVLYTYEERSYLKCVSRENNVKRFLELVPSVDLLDVLSDSGSSAFYYAVHEESIPEANHLLDLGADPTCFEGNRNPIELLEQKCLKDNKFYPLLVRVREIIKLKTEQSVPRMPVSQPMSIPSVPTTFEERKSIYGEVGTFARRNNPKHDVEKEEGIFEFSP